MAEIEAVNPTGGTVAVVGGAGIPVTAIADAATADADATFGTAERDLINELKAQLNLALAACRTAGIVAT